MVRIDLETAPFMGDFEIVERKGIGHPDTVCDSLAEEYSRALSRFYLDRFGKILHHNLDKAILVGGEATPKFGGGEIKEPIEFTLVGRATYRYRGEDFRKEIEEIYYETAKEWLRRNLPHLDVDRHINLYLKARAGSEDLTDLFEREGEVPLANDTSFGVGFYPFTKAEKLAYKVERFLNSPQYKADNVHAKEILGDYPLSVEINVADDYGRGSVYITVTGTSAEAGDDGQVGRGNRVNPVSHVGKIYNIAANMMAREVVEKFPAVENVYIYLVSQIGRPINEPQLVHTRVWGGVTDTELQDIKEYVADRVREIGTLWKKIVYEGVEVA